MGMSEPASISPDIDLFFDDQLVAQILLNPIQNAFPWYEGSLVEGPALARWRGFVRAYNDAEIEREYCPHHPDEGLFEETDLAAYVAALTELRDARASGRSTPDEDDAWLAPWSDAPLERLDEYLGFISFQRWRAVTRVGAIVEGVPLPPSLDLDAMRFAYRL